MTDYTILGVRYTAMRPPKRNRWNLWRDTALLGSAPNLEEARERLLQHATDDLVQRGGQKMRELAQIKEALEKLASGGMQDV